MKNKTYKNLGNVLIALMLVTTVIPAFLTMPVKADGTSLTGISPNVSNTTIGNNFNITIWCNPGTDTFDTWKIWNLTFDYTTKKIVNATFGGIWQGSTGASTWTGFYDPGTIDNNNSAITSDTTAWQGFTVAAVSSNVTLSAVNMTAVGVGIVYFNLSDLKIELTGVTMVNTTLNYTFYVFPAVPTSFTATAYNTTVINLSWANLPSGADNIVVCNKSGSYPTSPLDGTIYNESVIYGNTTYNYTGLINCTQHYFRLWTWNQTANMYSEVYLNATGTTNCDTNFTFAGVNPANESTTANCTYSIPVNVTVINKMGASFICWQNCSNGYSGSTTTVANTSVGSTMTSLSHNTKYWWNVTVSQTTGDDSISASYWFTTGNGGGSAPAVGTISPTNASTSVDINNMNLSAVVTDADSDTLNVTFYWGNGTVIGWNSSHATGTKVWMNTTSTLVLNTTYYWYVVVNDSCYTTQSGVYNFKTDAPKISITKEWLITSNNTIRVFINVTNIGEVNLTNVVVNDTYGSNITVAGSVPENDTGHNGTWTLPGLNLTGETKVNISVWLNLTGPIPNGTTIQNTVNVTYVGVEYNRTTFADPPLMAYTVTKWSNQTVFYWNDTGLNYTINVTNTGDFYLNWVQINETYSPNMTYWQSNVTPNQTNETFNLTQIVPGAMGQVWINVNKTAADLVNGTRIWNNITVKTNETSAATTTTSYVTGGIRTEAIRITYNTDMTDVSVFGNQIFIIMGLVILIGAIFFIVVLLRSGGFFGGGE